MSDNPTELSKSVAPLVKDRRADPRYKFTAAAEVVEDKSGIHVESRVGDLSRQGCYLDTTSPLPLGTGVTVRITKGRESFQGKARVVFHAAGKGMGLLFTTVDPSAAEILKSWLASSLESSWLATTRSRSQRIVLRLRVLVGGKNGLGTPFEEEAFTQAVSAHGALILLSTSVSRGQGIILTNASTTGAVECIVAHIGTLQDKLVQVGLAFKLPNPKFWNAAFPPDDWSTHHPDAKRAPDVR